MSNFYVVMAGHDKVIDASGATTCRRKFNAPSLQTKNTKNEGHSENMGFNMITVRRFQMKRKKMHFLPRPKNPVKQTTLHGKFWCCTSYPGGNKQEKLKKAFRLKLLELGKTRTKKAGPDMSNFYVVMAGHHLVIDASRATTCRCIFNAPSLQTKNTKNERHSENMGFNGKRIWKFQTEKNNSSLNQTILRNTWLLDITTEFRPGKL